MAELTYFKKFDTKTDYNEYINGSPVLPNVSIVATEDVYFTDDGPEPPHDYSKDYLTTIAKENGTISFNIWKSMGTNLITSISYSTDGGDTWTTTQNKDDKEEHLAINVNVNEGDKVLWKGDAQQTGYFDEDDYGDYVGSFFSSTAGFDVEGNIMSLLFGDDFIGKTELEHIGQFNYLFSDYDEEKECLVVNAENLVLPATTLTNWCYSYMFAGCTSLTQAPVLPATTLTDSCYNGMFAGCTSLTTTPELPATTLADNCYNSMFSDCSSLTTAPELQATTLADGCYINMFGGCTSLTTAPELPATTLVELCYSSMFQNCSSLNYVKCLATNISAYNCTVSWVDGVASSGTFVKNSNMSSWGSGTSGIPTNWTVQDA